MSELVDGDQVGDHVDRLLSPEVALLKKDGARSLVAGLVQQGLFPAVSGAQPEAADGGVVVHEDGLIRAVHAVPSLHLHGRLARVAEETAPGQWQLTPESVRRAGGSRTKANRLLDELDKLHRGALPPKLIAQVKAWGGYYGHVSVGTLTLLEFRDKESLDELRKHADLQPYLTPFPAGNRALAVIPTAKLAEVTGILDRMGVRLREGL
jgi:hypothetical protein